MNHKFGGGKRPTGTPSLAMSSVVVVVSLLAGASVVHNIYKPDLLDWIGKSKVEMITDSRFIRLKNERVGWRKKC
uniref:Uncharacterized protein n=1 Tax=Cannabis sativa TaxID=3483 RepID=A0A803Q9Z1_CANSA